MLLGPAVAAAVSFQHVAGEKWLYWCYVEEEGAAVGGAAAGSCHDNLIQLRAHKNVIIKIQKKKR